MSKALIVTFHCVPNYGASLQVLALQKTLSKYCDSVKILDYRPRAVTEPYKLIKTNSFKSILLSLYNLRINFRRDANFKKFYDQYYQMSLERYTEVVTSQESDYVFLGSDQIWNPRITGGYDKVYFGGFSTIENSKTISYAASIGVSSLNEEEIKQLELLIGQVDYVSVREEKASEIINTITDKPVEVVLDPTLLLEKEEWDRIKKNRTNHGSYLLIYNLANYPETEEIAYMVSKKMNLEIIEITTSNKKPLSKKKHKIIRDVGPDEFIGLVSSAEFIVTDSYHGTIFSLIYHKPFYTIPNKTKGSRMVELLDRIGLNNRLIKSTDNFKVSSKMDYKKVDEAIYREKIKSLEFIKKSLGVKNEQN